MSSVVSNSRAHSHSKGRCDSGAGSSTIRLIDVDLGSFCSTALSEMFGSVDGTVGGGDGSVVDGACSGGPSDKPRSALCASPWRVRRVGISYRSGRRGPSRCPARALLPLRFELALAPHRLVSEHLDQIGLWRRFSAQGCEHFAIASSSSSWVLAGKGAVATYRGPRRRPARGQVSRELERTLGLKVPPPAPKTPPKSKRAAAQKRPAALALGHEPWVVRKRPSLPMPCRGADRSSDASR
mmetsp:Transcript_70640/g.229483  ORF Transcript_70640/g.229483 Transcript_70640/m.229483 type:complete len:240 (-) Transcript_70640:56-775(-)